MNELAVKQESSVAISDSTKELIKHGVSKNTLAAYGRALTKWDTWLSTVVSPRELNDAVLVEYLTHLHESGKSPQRSHKWWLPSNGSPRMLIDKSLERSPLEHCQVFVATVETAVALNIEEVKNMLTLQ